jgi:hypothetical protein
MSIFFHHIICVYRASIGLSNKLLTAEISSVVFELDMIKYAKNGVNRASWLRLSAVKAILKTRTIDI